LPYTLVTTAKEKNWIAFMKNMYGTDLESKENGDIEKTGGGGGTGKIGKVSAMPMR
jgi:hypothetical protein